VSLDVFRVGDAWTRGLAWHTAWRYKIRGSVSINTEAENPYLTIPNAA
jgi:hypothetical protein